MKTIGLYFIVSMLCTAIAYAHEFEPVKSYEEITKYGLEAKIYVDDNGIPRLLQISSKDKTKPQPEWMQAFYLAPAYRTMRLRQRPDAARHSVPHR
jgi:hypothetical protein